MSWVLSVRHSTSNSQQPKWNQEQNAIVTSERIKKNIVLCLNHWFDAYNYGGVSAQRWHSYLFLTDIRMYNECAIIIIWVRYANYEDFDFRICELWNVRCERIHRWWLRPLFDLVPILIHIHIFNRMSTMVQLQYNQLPAITSYIYIQWHSTLLFKLLI